MSYLPCELHCHSVHSDGDYTVCELQKKAIDDHLAIIALTDHNTFSGWDEIDDNIIPVIRGIEWTTYYGHLLVLGANDFVDWRDANADNIDEKIKQIKAVGGLVGVAHPFQLGSPLCTGGHWDFNVRNWQNVDYIEVWHKNLYSNKKENEKALELWTSLLIRDTKFLQLTAGIGTGRKIPATMDVHILMWMTFRQNPQCALSGLAKPLFRMVLSLYLEYIATVLQAQ